MKHNHYISKSLVAVFCKNCKKMFYRDGDLVSFSSDYSSKETKKDISRIEDVETYLDWLIFTGDFCEDCIPPMPLKVKKDIQKEKERRRKDILNYRMNKDIRFIPSHQPIQDVSLEESYVETIEDRRRENGKTGQCDSINRPAEQRQRSFREKIGKYIRNAIHISGRHSKK